MALTDRFWLTDGRERALVRALQVVLVGLVLTGLVAGDVGVVVNAGGALVATALPVLLRREYGVSVDPGLVLWLTVAVVLHAVGTVGQPSLYERAWWWDVVTHVLSGSVVAGVGYASVRAVDVHAEDIYLPPEVLPVFVLLFTLAAGVLWEVLEFAATLVADHSGTESVLIVFGPGDIVTDLIATGLAGLAVALWGTEYLRGLTYQVGRTFLT